MNLGIGWFFSEETSPSDRYVDEFADSKFSIDRWVSFAREIIQNSLDVHDDNLPDGTPVVVKMEYTNLPKQNIPGCEELEHCLRRARDGGVEKAINAQTINRYNRGLELLSKDTIPCLKVSDFNTIGVRSGRDNEWGALVFDEGKSLKIRPGSAGSHGVGKKAPFIISAVNTVFYSTYNKADEFLFQGKTSIINWTDNEGKTRNGKGWYGHIDEQNVDRRQRITHLIRDDVTNVDPFFKREDQYGTDVIIVGVLLDDFEIAKEKIINSILESFFVAIHYEKLEVEIFGETINKSNLFEYIERYYVTGKRNFTHIEGIEGNVFGNLMNYYKAFLQDPITFDVCLGEKRYGKCSVFFSLENDKDKKCYCIFRNHGMKICDISLGDAEQPFSAVVYLDDCPEDPLDDKDRLNARLGDVENAAHNTFVIDSEDFICPDETKRLVELIYSKVAEIIIEKTKIEALKEIPLEGLDEMMAIQGMLTTKLTTKKIKIKTRKSTIRKKSEGRKANDYEEGVTNVGGLKNGKHHKKGGLHKPAKEGDDFKTVLFKKYDKIPYFIKTDNGYSLHFTPSESGLADIHILPISVEGKMNYVPRLLVGAEANDKQLLIDDNVIRDVNMVGGESLEISFKITNNYDYALECDVYVGGNKND